jgi:hypothetical protein
MDLTKLKEELDAFDDWNDEAYEDERGDIEYDNFDDHEVEDGYGRDEFIDGSDDIDEETAMDRFVADDTSVDEWWSRLSNGDIQDDTDNETDSFLAANESIESLNAKEAKLREALKEIEDAKAKLTK